MTLIFTGYITIMYFNKPVSAFVLKWSALCPQSREPRGAIPLLQNDKMKETAFIDDPNSLEKGAMGETGTSRASYGTGHDRMDGTSSKGL